MKLKTLSSQHQRLSWLIGEARKFNADQIELQSHWAQYVCVLAAGFLENAIKEIYGNYARSCSNSSVAAYVESRLKTIQNPKTARFLETARSFSKDWAEKLEAHFMTNGNGEAIDAIISNRHRIAHGQSSDITLLRLSEYLNKSVTVIEFIELQCSGR